MSTAEVGTLQPPGLPALGIDLRLLGGFELTAAGTPVTLPESAQRLVALVAVNRRPMARAVAAATLWPEKSEARAHANLRSSLWRLNDMGPEPVLVSRGTSLAIGPGVRVDVTALEEAGWALTRDPTMVGRGPDADLFVLPLLPGWYDDWVVMERERLVQLQVRFLEQLVVALVSAADLTRALDHAVRLVMADPLRERSQLCLLRVYAAEGSWGQLHHQLATYEDLLHTTFGCEVTSAFRREVDTLLSTR